MVEAAGAGNWRRGLRSLVPPGLGLIVSLAVVISPAAVAQKRAAAVEAPGTHRAAKTASNPRTPAPAPQVTIKDVVFQSAALGREMHYRIILPAGYAETNRRYPTLYLLHGLTGSYINWESNTNLVRYAEPLALIIVMPDGDNSWYTNSAAAPADKYEDYIADDLLAEIDKQYRTIRSGYGRGIAGLSMGGYGALKIALKHPGLFAFAGSLSGALNAATGLNVPLDKPHLEHMAAIFGPPDSSARAENDIFALLKKAQPTAFTRVPYFYIDCGTADGFLKINRDFVAQLQQQKIEYEYHEIPGAHMWTYWDDQVQLMLASLVRHMKIAGK